MTLHFLVVVLITGIVAAVVGVWLIGDRIFSQARNKVRMDINSAWEVYKQRVHDVHSAVRHASTRYHLRDAIVARDWGEVTSELEEVRKSPPDSPDYEDLDLIVRETTRCRKIVKELLDFARETKFGRKPSDLNKVILDTFSVVCNQVSFQNVQVRTELNGSLAAAPMAGNEMQQVFTNLALNAAEAMPCGGTITILTGPDAVGERAVRPRQRRLRDAAVDDLERDFVLDAIERNDWDITKAAQETGVQRANFHALMRKHGIRRPSL